MILFFVQCGFSHLARQSRYENITKFLFPKPTCKKDFINACVTFHESSFVFVSCTLKLRGRNFRNYQSCKTFTSLICLVSVIICRLDFLCFGSVHLLIYSLCMGNFFSKTNDKGNWKWGLTLDVLLWGHELVCNRQVS